jgi:8-oxo-dGTP diphosphatase
MSLLGQRLEPDRYALIPRTLTFLIHGDEILLIKIADDRGAWAGLYNGVGGHIEKGEDPHTAALREIREETNLSPKNLSLCGVIQIDTKINPGICLFVFMDFVEEIKDLYSGPEGTLEWIKLSDLADTPLVEDLPLLIPVALKAEKNGSTFFGRYHYDLEDKLTIAFTS